MDLSSNPKRNKSDSNDIYNSSFNGLNGLNGNHINGFKNGNGHKEKDVPNDTEKEKTKEIAKSYLNILNGIGEDSTREGLLKTPDRAAKALLYFTKGYQEDLKSKLIFGYNFISGQIIMIYFIYFSRCQRCHI